MNHLIRAIALLALVACDQPVGTTPNMAPTPSPIASQAFRITAEDCVLVPRAGSTFSDARWKATVQNTAAVPVSGLFEVRFMDKHGFQVGYDNDYLRFAATESRNLSGSVLVQNAEALLIEECRFSID